jgi:hypothetical protein
MTRAAATPPPAEAVVDDLEAIEVEVQHREPAARRSRLEFLQPLPEPLDEVGAVAQAGQRIDEHRVTQLLVGERAIRRVGQRSGDSRRLAPGAARRNPAAQETAIAAVLVAQPVLALEVRGAPCEVHRERLLEGNDILGMDAIDPLLRRADE